LLWRLYSIQQYSIVVGICLDRRNRVGSGNYGELLFPLWLQQQGLFIHVSMVKDKQNWLMSPGYFIRSEIEVSKYLVARAKPHWLE
jgi:hypothetical protein